MPAQPTYEELKQRVGKLEEELLEQKKYAAELQRRVLEVEQSNRELSRFLQRISHDLQEPLDVVARYLQFVEARYRDRIDPDAAGFIDSAVDGADRMHQLITELSAYVRRRNSGGGPINSEE